MIRHILAALLTVTFIAIIVLAVFHAHYMVPVLLGLIVLGVLLTLIWCLYKAAYDIIDYFIYNYLRSDFYYKWKRRQVDKKYGSD